MAFGIAFEVPIFVILLVKTGMVTVEKLRSVRGYVIVGAFVMAAVVTPPDVLSQFMLAFPLCILFEVAVFVAARLNKREPEPDDDAESSEEAAAAQGAVLLVRGFQLTRQEGQSDM